MEKGYIVNLPGAWGVHVPRVYLCACIYGGALAGVTCAYACVVRGCLRGGWRGGRGWCVKACLCVGKAGVSRHAWGGGLVLVFRFNTMYWICVKDLA